MPDSQFTYRPLQDEDHASLGAIMALAFGGKPGDAGTWIERNGPETGRVIAVDDRIAGGLFFHPMGQFFGGRSVSMAGIGAVCVDPGDRAAGGATLLMHETVRELRREGFALSTLFPATQPLYRRAGYEPAGHHFQVTVSMGRLFTQDRELEIRRATDDDIPSIDRLHREAGRENDGNIDRSEMMWRRVRDPLKQTVHAFVIEGESGLEGYVYYLSRPNARNHQDLYARDLVARTPAAARRLLTFFRDHGSLVDSVVWRGCPADPLLMQAREQRHEIQVRDTWMVRIVDVERALEERGYGAGVVGEVHLEVEDDLCPENAGRIVLSVTGGRGKVERGGSGAVRLDVRTLAAIYTGFLSATQARSSLGLACSDEDAALLDGLFAGRTPWMQDGF